MSISLSKQKLLRYSLLFFIVLFLSVIAILVYMRLSPKEVRVTNITSNSASLSWVTKSKTDGVVYVKEGKNLILPFVIKNDNVSYDDRDVAAAELQAAEKVQAEASANGTVTSEILSEDVKVEKTGKYYTHHITVKNLDPSKEYSFYVGSGSLLWASKNGVSGASTFETYALSDAATLPQIDPAYGKIVNGGSDTYENDALVYVSLKDDSISAESTTLSAVVRDNGSWYIDLSSARVIGGTELFLSKYTEPSESMIDSIEVITSYGSADKEVSRNVDSPAEDIVVSESGSSSTSSLVPVAYASPCYGRWSVTCSNGATHCENRGNIQEGFVQVWGSGAQSHWASEACKVAVSTNNCNEPDNPSLCPSSGGVGGGGSVQEVSAPASSSSYEDPDCGNIISQNLVKSTGDLCDAGSYCPLSAASSRWPNRGGCDGGGSLGCFGCSDGNYRCGEDSSSACGIVTSTGGTTSSGSGTGVTVNPGINGSSGTTGAATSGTSGPLSGNGDTQVLADGTIRVTGLSGRLLAYYAEGICTSDNLGQACPGYSELVCAHDVVDSKYLCVSPGSGQLDSRYNFYHYEVNPDGTKKNTLPEGTSEATEGWGGSACAADPAKVCNDCRGVVAQYDGRDYLCTDRVFANGLGDYHWIQLVPQGEICQDDGTGLKCQCDGSYVDKRIGQVCKQGLFEAPGRITISRGQQCCGNSAGCWCDAYGTEEIFNDGEWCKQISEGGCWDLESQDIGTVCDKEGHTCEETSGATGLTCRGNQRTSCPTTTSLNSGRAVLGASTSKFSFSPSGETVIFEDSGIYCTIYNGEKYCFEVLQKNAETLLYIDENGNGEYDEGTDINVADVVDLELSKESTTRTYEISAGFNLVSFDFVDPSEPNMASDLLTSLNADYSDAFYSIARFDSGKWEVIGNRNGDTYGSQDFQIIPGRGYVLKSKQDLVVTLSGKGIAEPVPVSLMPGWNLVGVHGTGKAYTAESLIDSVNEQDGFTAVNVTEWDSSKAKYEGLQKETSDNGVADVYGFDFPINVTSGYFLKIDNGSGLWTPAK
ncbi:fibronectin type III domain-containing protein [Candidatus Dojkabacteria bacterium]|uniref:Fibronectin type III domain-containing protein n=1 Tax=Candidatus Dojkabacteria bacterium TaxID=2099670 RepID=A0A955KV33_9BACT|nr:fibronectin type III domain-containing protein [Candidatus Dojkabacteria bacterium]